MEFGSPVLSYFEYFCMFKYSFRLGGRVFDASHSLIYNTTGIFFDLNKLLIKERQLDKSNK